MKEDLRVEVFDENTIEIIEDTRVITDLKTLSTEVMKQGPVLLGIKKVQSFLEVVRRLTSLDDISDDEIKDNIKRFLKVLHKHVVGIRGELNSRDLIKN